MTREKFNKKYKKFGYRINEYYLEQLQNCLCYHCENCSRPLQKEWSDTINNFDVMDNFEMIQDIVKVMEKMINELESKEWKY